MPNRNTEHRDAMQNARADSGDDFDKDLERDNQRGAAGSTMRDLTDADRAGGNPGAPLSATSAETDQGEYPQHSRRGQAQSPVEATLNQPERKREGHPGGARDS